MLSELRKWIKCHRMNDGPYEIYVCNDDPAFGLAERYLEKHNFTSLSAGCAFVGRVEDFARFEAALAVAPGKG